MKIKEKVNFIIQYFSTHLPNPTTELHYKNAYQLTVAVILSAQCTDKRVNQTTPAFFRRFPDFKSLSCGSIEEIRELIKSISYPNSKARHLKAMAELVVQQYHGQLPSSVKELMKLPGIGRKTANVITSVLYRQPNMPVDTHVFRVTRRIGLGKGTSTHLQIEKQLLKLFPSSLIPDVHHWFILHGRYVCKARKPKCTQCGVSSVCNYYQIKNKTR